MKRERDRERAEAELSALVRLRYASRVGAHSQRLIVHLFHRDVPGVATLLHTELNCGDRVFVFPLLESWTLEIHAQSLDRVRVFCRQLFEVRVVFVPLVHIYSPDH